MLVGAGESFSLCAPRGLAGNLRLPDDLAVTDGEQAAAEHGHALEGRGAAERDEFGRVDGELLVQRPDRKVVAERQPKAAAGVIHKQFKQL